MSQTQNELTQGLSPEIAPEQSMAEQVLSPGKPGMVFVDGGCASYPYVHNEISRGEQSTSRNFGGATYIALDGGKSRYVGGGGSQSWDSQKGFPILGDASESALQMVLPPAAREAQRDIEIARTNGIDAHYIRADLKSLPFEDESVDELFMGEVLLASGLSQESISDIVTEAGRVVKPGGMIVLKEVSTNPSEIMAPNDKNEDRLQKEMLAGKMVDTRDLDRSRALRLFLKSAGFDVEIHSLGEGKESFELIKQLNSIYPTTSKVGRLGAGVYVLARKQDAIHESTQSRAVRKGLRKLLGRKALA